VRYKKDSTKQLAKVDIGKRELFAASYRWATQPEALKARPVTLFLRFAYCKGCLSQMAGKSFSVPNSSNKFLRQYLPLKYLSAETSQLFAL
jgi:hypothetical protein